MLKITRLPALQAEGQALQANTGELVADNQELGEHVERLRQEVRQAAGRHGGGGAL
jgi:cell division protein FtsB